MPAAGAGALAGWVTVSCNTHADCGQVFEILAPDGGAVCSRVGLGWDYPTANRWAHAPGVTSAERQAPGKQDADTPERRGPTTY